MRRSSTHLAPAADLPRPVIDACRAVAAHLRERHAGFYQRTADETEALLADEVEAAQAEDLGKIDTFRFEEDKVLKAALAALGARDCDRAAEWAGLRVDPKPASTSFWLRDDPTRQSAWQLVRDAARLGQAIARAGERSASAERRRRPRRRRRAPTSSAAPPSIRRIGTSSSGGRPCSTRSCRSSRRCATRLDGMRRAWREWADAWARDFNALCRAHGFLPAPRTSSGRSSTRSSGR